MIGVGPAPAQTKRSSMTVWPCVQNGNHANGVVAGVRREGGNWLVNPTRSRSITSFPFLAS